MFSGFDIGDRAGKRADWARTVEIVKMSAVVCIGFPSSNPDVATARPFPWTVSMDFRYIDQLTSLPTKGVLVIC